MKNRDLPAYPIQPTFNNEGQVCEENFQFNGLTKRELIAAMAMQGLLSSGDGWNANDGWLQILKASVKYADALLAELDKPIK